MWIMRTVCLVVALPFWTVYLVVRAGCIRVSGAGKNVKNSSSGGQR